MGVNGSVNRSVNGGLNGDVNWGVNGYVPEGNMVEFAEGVVVREQHGAYRQGSRAAPPARPDAACNGVEQYWSSIVGV